VQRGSLKEVLELLPSEKFIQTHRSFVVNIEAINYRDNQQLLIQDTAIPMSRNRRKEVISKIEMNKNYHSEHQGYHSEQSGQKNI